MSKYRYTVINAANQQLHGTISSPDETSARKELNELGFSIISIESIKEDQGSTAEESKIPTFEFTAIDKNQKRVLGTIQAETDFEAYKRLVLEYKFEVEYVIDNNLSEDEKIKARKKGSYEFQTQLEEEQGVLGPKETADEKDLKEFEIKQKILKKQIDFVLGKVKELLDRYKQEIKPIIKEKIRQQVDKILRIKNSTNLDYVRKTTEDLLNYLQKEEMFLHEESHYKERTNMVVEAQSMMMELKRSKTKTHISIKDSLRNWREKNIVNTENPPIYNKIADFFIRHTLGIQYETHEILSIKENINSINSQIRHYIIMYFQAPSAAFKKQTKEGLMKLWQQRKKLKTSLKEEKKKLIMTRKTSIEPTAAEKLSGELLSFTGWLLTFYLIYYFISIYAISKDFGLTSIPQFFYIYRSAFLKYFMSTLFLFYSALSIKMNFFKRNDIATLVITPVFLFSIVLIYLNF